MRKIGVFGIALAAVPLTAGNTSAKEVNAWTMDFGDRTTIPVNTAGDLKNMQSKKCLVQRSDWWGEPQADWNLATCGGRQAKILRKDPSKTGPIICGEKFALQLGD